MSRSVFTLSAIIALLVMPFTCQSEGFGINALRVIYNEGESTTTVTLRNTDPTTPNLVQAGVSRISSAMEATPFDVIPPLFRLEPASVHQVRIVMRPHSLPSDRESVFYFRALAIPASKANQSLEETARIKGKASFGVSNTIKLFYRPQDLPGEAIDAQRGLQFSRVEQGLKVSNPSAYHVSFAAMSVGGKKLPLDENEAKMIAPHASYIWRASGVQGDVKWKTIGDNGEYHEFSQKLP
ncbi:fimbrial biogenesis chaperone [Candidatus Pantoea multigeneris]|uniref:Molecular chaperone n=1 Tax=Candidatus Pantoea multigeneris TaxID=2608357 RepID=A0ABX0RJ88_9GAMM|nr:molecular chaperone [Pantoea multigeneris]NIF23459.1 molecular chaperone [Pantoea multigeneris]